MAAIHALTQPPLTGGILAGGEALRLGGADKGLMPWRGRPLVAWVLAALAAQTTRQLINANRNAADYARLGVPLVPDAGGSGPLAGLAVLLAATGTDWLLCVPCDAPLLPHDLGLTLLHGAQQADAPASYLHDGARAHPTFCCVRTTLADSARQGAQQGLGLIAWLTRERAVACTGKVPVNLNTPEDFARTESAS